MYKYFIVTPTKNEEETIPNLIRSIEKQTIKPVLWVIVDESSDNTKEIIKELTKKYEWVKSIFLKKSKGYLGINYGAACKKGFDFGIEFCKRHKIEYEYIGLIDADAVIDEDFFERLMKEFEKDPQLGIASGSDGSDKLKNAGKLVNATWVEDFPIGPARLWRKRCFEETGGYQETMSPDSVSNIKAKLRGWKIRRFKEIKVMARKHATARGYWKGYEQLGKDNYFLNYHPLVIILKAIKYSFKKPYYIGIAMFFGYFSCAIRKEEKIEDDEIKYYFRYTRPKEIVRYYLNMLKTKLKRGRT